MMHPQTKVPPKSWLAFDLNVLSRMKFDSAVLPYCDSPALGAYLKRWNVRVSANDPLPSLSTRLVAHVGNGGTTLSEEDVDVILEDAYVPGYRLSNPSLTDWFTETDAWWFDNVFRNIQSLTNPASRALASALVLATGDYVFSFTRDTRELRQPLSRTFRRLWSTQAKPFDNGQQNTCSNKNPDEFLSESTAELMFMRLPHAHAMGFKNHLGRFAWREEWVRGSSDVWNELETSMRGRLGSATETKSQYLHLLEETLRRAGHMRNWAVAHVEDGFIQTQDVVETIGSIRRVDTVFTKDFSELTGAKAVIITA